MKKLLKLSIAAVAVCGMSVSAGTLENVKKDGFLKCGVNIGATGFSEVGTGGKYQGLDVDGCRSVAAAVLGDASKVKYIGLNAKERFAALQSGEIDILYRGTTWTNTRDASLGLNFAGVNFYDGQAFLINKRLGVKSALKLDGAAVCVQAGTTTELNLADYFKANGMKYKSVSYDSNDQVTASFEAGRCDVLSSDSSQLYGIRSKLKNPSNYEVLPEIISKEPLGPVVRQGDDQWFNIARWTYFATVAAEENGITSKNIDSLKNSKSPAVRRILGVDGKLGANLGLNKDWAYQIIKQVGNYGEIFERNVGMNTPLQIKRGLNASWKNGGLQYSPPFK